MDFVKKGITVEVYKQALLQGTIQITPTEKSFTSYGTKKFLQNEIGEVKDYLDNNDL